MISVLIDPTFRPRRELRLAFIRSEPITRSEINDPLDREILGALATACEPVGVWQLLNALAKSSQAASRAETRSVRRQALARINPLVRRGLVRRIGRRAVALA